MRILYDCFSCSPYYGSDEGIGWIWPYHMRKYHEVWAVVRKDRKPDIEKYCKENCIHDIHFIYADVPDWMNIYYRNLKKGTNGTLDFLFYQYVWQFFSAHAVKKVHKKVHFDLVHKVGTNDFRFSGRMASLGIPLILGPIGGAQETPAALQYYVREHQKSEKLRALLNNLLSGTLNYRKTIRRADRIFVSNQETKQFLAKRIRDSRKCKIFTEVGWSGELPVLSEKDSAKQSFTMMWAGRMEYRKGLELLIDVLDLLPDEADWKLILCGSGTEIETYKKTVSEKCYADKVVFKGKIPFEELRKVYSVADLFVFPSLRETTGTVIIEAMAHAVPVLALKQGGASEVITDKTGFLIAGGSRDEILHKFADVIENCIRDPKSIKQYGFNARKRIEQYYCWDKRIEKMSKLYDEICSGKQE